jgi:hypothetical protein
MAAVFYNESRGVRMSTKEKFGGRQPQFRLHMIQSLALLGLALTAAQSWLQTMKSTTNKRHLKRRRLNL